MLRRLLSWAAGLEMYSIRMKENDSRSRAGPEVSIRRVKGLERLGRAKLKRLVPLQAEKP